MLVRCKPRGLSFMRLSFSLVYIHYMFDDNVIDARVDWNCLNWCSRGWHGFGPLFDLRIQHGPQSVTIQKCESDEHDKRQSDHRGLAQFVLIDFSLSVEFQWNLFEGGVCLEINWNGFVLVQGLRERRFQLDKIFFAIRLQRRKMYEKTWIVSRSYFRRMGFQFVRVNGRFRLILTTKFHS